MQNQSILFWYFDTVEAKEFIRLIVRSIVWILSIATKSIKLSMNMDEPERRGGAGKMYNYYERLISYRF